MADTIAAIATGNVLSAIGIIRLSGEGAIQVADKVFSPSSGRKLSSYPDRQLVYGKFHDIEGNILDICLCTISHGPGSYTGENTAELQCHGSPTVLRAGLQALFEAGARQALAGEFTKRAFLNGRMDLTQAEAVVDIINAETIEAARNAAGQLLGAIFRKIDAIYDKLVDMTSHFHAVLDYPDEDIDPFELDEYSETLANAAHELQILLDSFERGQVMTEGIRAAIVGRPNAGKSSLLNALLGYDRAIVTDIPGTTRDTIEEKIRLGGVLLRLSDTAGLRGTDDPVEKIGVERALSAAHGSQLVFAVFDGSQPLSAEDEEAVQAAAYAEHSVAIINKSDLTQALDASVLYKKFDAVCRVSALDKTGLDILAKTVRKLFPAPDTVRAGEILTNARQADAVRRALESINAARTAMDAGVTPDAVLTEVEGAMDALGELTGRVVHEDVTQRIFSRFCVGK